MSVSLEARYSHQFLAGLKKLNPSLQRRMLEPIETNLLTDPLQQGEKRVGNSAPSR